MSDCQELDGLSEEERASYLAFREKVKNTNISEQTLLATDYLNHFNEIVMLMEMIPDMPDLLEEAKEWQPKSYQEHFRESTFSDRDLAVEAYDHVPQKFRDPFEHTIGQINRLIATSIERIENDIQLGEPELVRANAVALTRVVQRLMDVASGIIHGSQKTMDQGEIDNLIGTEL